MKRDEAKRMFRAKWSRSMIAPDASMPGVSLVDLQTTITDIITCLSEIEHREDEVYKKALRGCTRKLTEQSRLLNKRVKERSSTIRAAIEEDERIRIGTGGV